MDNTDKIKAQVLSRLSAKWQKILKNEDFFRLEEIRFRRFLPVMLYYSGQKVKKLTSYSDKDDLSELLISMCRNSVYAYRENLKEGFITLPGGHRAGFSGRGVKKNGELYTLSDISGINIRLAREVKGCADSILQYVILPSRVRNTLIISPPSAGKTTMLRELARKASMNFKVCIVDERSELAACFDDGAVFDLGEQTDVLDGISKKEGVTMALRSLSPEVIVTDEVDTKEDYGAIRQIMGAGAKIITTTHSESFEEIERKNPAFLKLFEVLIMLSRKNGAGTVEEVRDVYGSYI